MSSLSLLTPTGDPAQEIVNSILDKPAVIFAGQGSQEKNMGRDLAEANPDAMELWKKAENISGLPLREIYWDGSEEEMSDTKALQPALTVTNINLWNEFKAHHNIVPAACAGHSLGEFSALAACGILSPESALEITSLRGRLMAEADPKGAGSMAAIVKLDKNTVDEIIEEASRESGELVIAANFNTPTQTVVSGAKNAINLVCQKARELKGRGIELKVSGAFHSPFMHEANQQLLPLLEKTKWNNPDFPIYCNVDGKPAKTGTEAKKSIFRQMISPVFWVNLIRNLYLAGIRWWMEISPRAVLGKMVGPSLAGLASHCENLRVDLLNSLSSVINYTF